MPAKPAKGASIDVAVQAKVNLITFRVFLKMVSHARRLGYDDDKLAELVHLQFSTQGFKSTHELDEIGVETMKFRSIEHFVIESKLNTTKFLRVLLSDYKYHYYLIMIGL